MPTELIALRIFFSKRVATRAIKVALFVGTILTPINHGNVIFHDNLIFDYTAEMLSVYFMPYSVSSVTETNAKMEANAVSISPFSGFTGMDNIDKASIFITTSSLRDVNAVHFVFLLKW